MLRGLLEETGWKQPSQVGGSDETLIAACHSAETTAFGKLLELTGADCCILQCSKTDSAKAQMCGTTPCDRSSDEGRKRSSSGSLTAPMGLHHIQTQVLSVD